MRKRFLGCPVDILGKEEILQKVLVSIQQGTPLRIEGLNVAKIIQARHDPLLMQALEEAELVHIDGAGVELAMRLLGYNPPPRRAGIDLMFDIIRLAEQIGAGVYLFGARQEIISATTENLQKQFPKLKIKGCRNGYYSEQEEHFIVRTIFESGAHIILIGISSPKKELFVRNNWDGLGCNVALGVGGSFDVVSGYLKRAPRWIQKIGFEWLYRMLQEPRRLWRRYTYTNLMFLLLVIREFCLCSRKPNRQKAPNSNQNKKPALAILGTRGIPARHGGFETFAEQLSAHLVKQGWEVSVYCQDNNGSHYYEEDWNGVRLIHIPVKGSDTIGSILFDWKSTLQAIREKKLILTLGYNTAVFSVLYRLAGVCNLVNMDGLEWRRAKWPLLHRGWLYLNERVACIVSNHLIADHPEIMKHLHTRVNSSKVSMIPYGADIVLAANSELLKPFGLEPDKYVLVVARLEPENSILDIVKAFSVRKRGYKLVLVGGFIPDSYTFHARLAEASSAEIIFLGAIYEKPVVNALRMFCRLYIHGHQVGGTNPSLLESMAAGAPVLAHDNPFNRWVAGSSARYFCGLQSCESELDLLLADNKALSELGVLSRERCSVEFSVEQSVSSYQHLLQSWWASCNDVS